LNGELEEEEEYIDHLYCVACNKSFKNESSFKNHETSKKHLNNIERLKREMLNEEADYKVNESLGNNVSDESDDDEEIEVVKKSKKSKKKNRVITHVEAENDDIEDVVETVDAIVLEVEDEKIETVEKPRKSAKAKRSKKIEQSNKPVQAPDPKVEKKADVDIDIAHTCVTCKSNFDSKNKLFAHLKKTNHGVFIPKESVTTTTNTKKSKHRK